MLVANLLFYNLFVYFVFAVLNILYLFVDLCKINMLKTLY